MTRLGHLLSAPPTCPFKRAPTTLALRQIAQEAIIARQDPRFFLALTECIRKIRAEGVANKLHGKAFWKCSEIKDLMGLAQDFLGLQINLRAGAPAIYLPMVDANHPFFDDLTRLMIADGGYADMDKLMTALDSKLIKGEVDYEKSKVSGAYAKLQLTMMMPREMFANDVFPAEEVAAIMLHEFGHGFTTLSMVGQVFRANMWLREALKVQELNIDPAAKEVFFVKLANDLKLTDKEKELVQKGKNPATVATVIIGQAVRPSPSAASNTIYDYTTCESMADQFAMRHGAGSHLASGLNRLFNMYGMRPGTASYMVGQVLGFVINVAMNVFTLGLLALLVVSLSSRANIYDAPAARMRRMRHDLMMQLRDDPDMSPKELEELNDSVKKINELMDAYPELDLSFYERVAKYVNPRFSRELAAEILEKDLEDLTNNQMGLAARRLKLAVK